MPTVQFLKTHILWSLVTALTIVVFVFSLMNPAMAHPPELASTDHAETPATSTQDVRLKANLQNQDTAVGSPSGGQSQSIAVGSPSDGQSQSIAVGSPSGEQPRHDVTSQPLRFGLVPYLTPAALVQTHRPLLEYLESRLQRPISVLTAPDFKSFLERANQGRYDFYFTAPHFAALAESRHGHRRLCRWSGELYGLVLVATDSTYQRIEDLRGKTVAEPGELSGLDLLGNLLLADHDLQPGKDVTIRNTNHNNALLSVAEGRVDATITAIMVYQSLDDDTKSQFRSIAQTERIPAPMFMANPAMPEPIYEAVKSALLMFSEDVQLSGAFSNLSGVPKLVPITDHDIERLAPLLSALETELRQ